MKVHLSAVTAALMVANAVQQIIIAYADLAPRLQAAYACLAAWFAVVAWLNEKS